MLTTLHGRVELDPMRVPTPAAMSTGQPTSFDEVLQQAVDASADREIEPRESDRPPDELSPDAQPDGERAHADAAPRDSAGEPHQEDQKRGDVETATKLPTDTTLDTNDTMHRGEPVRQTSAGKGADSPRSSSPTIEPLLVAFAAHGGRTTTNGPAVAGASNAIGAIAGSKAVGDAPTRGIDGAWQRQSTPTRAASVAAGFRTNAAASAELLDHARDSVWKQILLKLTPSGGEMRIRLDPPEFGELDVHMIVQDGNRLSLSIAAERQDMTLLLQRHLDELRQTLQSAGLHVADAEVHTRREGPGGRQFASDHERAGADHGDHGASHPAVQMGGYITAEGLDFWV